MLYGKIARGLVNKETRDLNRESKRVTEEIFNGHILPIMRAISAGKKLDRLPLKRAALAIHKAVSESSNTFWVEYSPSPRTVTSGSGIKEQVECSWLTANRFSDAPMLARLRVTLRPKRSMYQVILAPLEIRQHAYERMLQRSDERLDSIQFMLTQAETRMGLLCAMIEPGNWMDNKSLAFPMGDGLLLGTVVPTLYGDHAGDLVEWADVTKGKMTTQLGAQIERPWILMDRGQKGLGFLAKTYIGPNEMHPRQKALHAELVNIADSMGPQMDAVSNYCYFPKDISDRNDADVVKKIYGMCDALQERVIEVLSNASMARAMGNDDAPSSKILPTCAAQHQIFDRAMEVTQPTLLDQFLSQYPKPPTPFSF